MQIFDSRHRRRLLAGGIAVAALGLGGTGVAIARSGGDPGPAYSSSVTVADSGTESAADDDVLAAVAKITPDQARAAALAPYPAPPARSSRKREQIVVSGVEVTTAAGSRIDVKVDAGNGKVLAQASDDASQTEASPSAAPRPNDRGTGRRATRAPPASTAGLDTLAVTAPDRASTTPRATKPPAA